MNIENRMSEPPEFDDKKALFQSATRKIESEGVPPSQIPGDLDGRQILDYALPVLNKIEDANSAEQGKIELAVFVGELLHLIHRRPVEEAADATVQLVVFCTISAAHVNGLLNEDCILDDDPRKFAAAWKRALREPFEQWPNLGSETCRECMQVFYKETRCTGQPLLELQTRIHPVGAIDVSAPLHGRQILMYLLTMCHKIETASSTAEEMGDVLDQMLCLKECEISQAQGCAGGDLCELLVNATKELVEFCETVAGILKEAMTRGDLTGNYSLSATALRKSLSPYCEWPNVVPGVKESCLRDFRERTASFLRY